MLLEFKKLNEDAETPTRANPYDAGLDLVATSAKRTGGYIEYGTGIAVNIPKNCVGLLFPRSSISKYDLMLANSVGVIDSGYTGELKVRMNIVREQKLSGDGSGYDGVRTSKQYNVGDRIAQLVVMPIEHVELTEVTSFIETERGDGGFGSSGV